MATFRKRGDKWQVQVRRLGSRPLSKSFMILKDAEAWARQIEMQLDRNELPVDSRILAKVTLKELVERYRDTITPNKRSAENETISLNAFLRQPICLKRLSELRTADFAIYRDERLRINKPASVKRELDPIRHLFDVARAEWGLPLPENPLSRMSFSGFDQKRERRLNPAERDAILAATVQCRNPHIKPIILFALSTGMRRGEILNVSRSHWNEGQRSLLIPKTKNGHARTIPLSKEAMDILGTRSRDSEKMFPISALSLRLAWERLLKRAKVDDLRFHDLRHEAISRLFELGLSVPEAALVSGHRDPRMLFRYSHATRSRILEKFDSGV